MEPLLWRGFIIPIFQSSGTVSRSEISVKRSIREVISVWPPNFKNSFGISSIPQALHAFTSFTILDIFQLSNLNGIGEDGVITLFSILERNTFMSSCGSVLGCFAVSSDFHHELNAFGITI